MAILERYLAVHFLRFYLLVMLVLLALFGFLDLVDELSEVGEGSYHLDKALLYVASTFPTKLLQFSAIATLMGGSLALAALVRGSEILAMRAAGLSLARLAWGLLKAVSLLAAVLMLDAQFVAPKVSQQGFIMRQQALAGQDTLRTEYGFWSRDQRRFVNVGAIRHGRLPQDVDIYEFDPQGRLLGYLHARQARVVDEKTWELQQVTRKRWHGGILQTEFLPRLPWRSFLSPRQLASLELPPETLALTDLWRYVRYLKATRQEAEGYELLFWQRLLLPLNMAVMVLFLLPVAATHPRAGGFGWQVVVAVVLGVLYFLATQVIANLGLLWNLPPLLTALAPTGLILLLSLAWVRQLRE